MPGPEVKTGVDALMGLLKENGRMEISDAASKLGVSVELIEDWAAALEKANLIKIEHMMTKVYLLPITLTEEEAKLKERELGGVKEGVRREVGIEETTLKEVSEKLANLSQKWKGVEEVVNTQLKDLNQKLDELEKLREKSEELKQQIYKNIKDFEAPTKQIDQTLASYTTTLQQIQNETIPKLEERKKLLFNDLEKTIEEAKNIEKIVNDSNQKTQSLVVKTNELEKMLSATTLKLNQLSSQVNSKFSEITNLRNSSLKELEDLNKRIEELNKRLQELSSRTASISKSIEETKVFDSSKVQLLKEIDEAKSRINEISQNSKQITQNISSQKAVVENSLKRIQEIKKEAEEMKSLYSNLLARMKSDVEKELQKNLASLEAIKKKVSSLTQGYTDQISDLTNKSLSIDRHLALSLQRATNLLKEFEEIRISRNEINEKMLKLASDVELTKKEIMELKAELVALKTSVSSSQEYEDKKKKLKEISEKTKRIKEKREEEEGVLEEIGKVFRKFIGGR